jgi:antitoxin ParD1/3/4
VNEKVESGLYQTASEVVREALRLLKERDEAREQLRADVQAGFDQLSSGEGRAYAKASGRQLAERIKSRGRAARATTLDGLPIDSGVRTTLERLMPIYQKNWWPAHDRTNREWIAAVRPLIDRHGAATRGINAWELHRRIGRRGGCTFVSRTSFRRRWEVRVAGHT